MGNPLLDSFMRPVTSLLYVSRQLSVVSAHITLLLYLLPVLHIKSKVMIGQLPMMQAHIVAHPETQSGSWVVSLNKNHNCCAPSDSIEL